MLPVQFMDSLFFDLQCVNKGNDMMILIFFPFISIVIYLKTAIKIVLRKSYLEPFRSSSNTL